MKKYDYLFIDLDGPILEGKFRHYNCYKDIIGCYGGTPLDINEYWNLKRNMVKRDIVLKKSFFQGTYDDFLTMWMENIEKPEYLQFDYLKPDVDKTLNNFKNYFEKIYLVTMRNNDKNLLRQLKDLAIVNFFDEIIICHSTQENPKYSALKELRFNKALVIGDTEEDTKTAKLLGVKCIGITNGLRDKNYLDADYYADEICNIEIDTICSED